MAAPMVCDMCQAEPGTVMQTNLANGDVMVIGDSCQLPFYLTVAQTIIDGMPREVVAEYSEMLKNITDSLTIAIIPAESDWPEPEPAAPVSAEYMDNGDTGVPGE